MVKVNDIKSIKIPEKFDEKEKLMQNLRNAVGEIDIQMKNLKSRREYYNEILDVLDKEIQAKKELAMLMNRRDNKITVIQEELYSKF